MQTWLDLDEIGTYMHGCNYVATQLELCLHEQTQIVGSTACRVGSQKFHS